MNKPPFSIDVSCAKKGTLADLTPSFNFIVMLNSFTYGFQEVAGIEKNKHTENIQEGGVNDHPIVVGIPNGDISTLNLKRGILISDTKSTISSLAKSAAVSIPNNLLRKSALLALASLDASYALENGPAIGFIQVYDRFFKQDVISFSFFSLGVSRWRMTDLDAMNSSNFLIEEMELMHTGLKKLATNIIPKYSTSGLVNKFMS